MSDKSIDRSKTKAVLMTTATIGYIIYGIVSLTRVTKTACSLLECAFMVALSGIYIVFLIFNNFGSSRAILIPPGKDGKGLFMSKIPMYFISFTVLGFGILGMVMAMS